MENNKREWPPVRRPRRRGVNIRPIAVMLALVLLVGVAVGGTIAWLTDETDKVQNTFTAGNIDISLTETTGDTYKMVPGCTIKKDPYVTVEANSEDCYVFIKVEKSEGFDKYMSYTIGDGWTKLDSVDDVYYRVVETNPTHEQKFDVIKDHTIKVLDSVTKQMMDAIENKNPTLTVTAYAIQYQMNDTTPFKPADAWAKIGTP